MTAEYIRKNYCVDAVYSSDLPRAFQTAEHIARAFDLPIITDARLREINAGRWENKAFSELPNLFSEAFTVWREDLIHARCTGGESVLEVADRATNCLQTIATANPDKCIAIVAHATTIRASLWKISGATEDAMQSLCWGSNCGISELCFSNGELQICSQNITEHLSDLVTELPKNL
jgi:broad specificity phosphatase PhoE